MSQWTRRIQKFSVTEYDREILADARAAIDPSLQILATAGPKPVWAGTITRPRLLLISNRFGKAGALVIVDKVRQFAGHGRDVERLPPQANILKLGYD